MAKGAMIALLFSALVLLALASQVEAQCKAVNTTTAVACVISIENHRCDAGCKSALQPFLAQSPECICQLVALFLTYGRTLGITKADIDRLFVNCRLAAPYCN